MFFAFTSKVGCPKKIEIQNPWGNVMEKRGLIFEDLN